MTRIDLEIGGADLRWGAALSLLQSGFYLRAREGLSARAFMAEVLAFPAAYIDASVSTVFLNDQPVDDIDEARLAEGSRLALSAAMPGLVGAVMRRRSPYASFREAISHHGDPAPGAAGGGPPAGTAPPAEVLVRVKLFNAVMVEKGPGVLSRGILLGGREAAEARSLFDAPPPGPAEGPDRLADFVYLRLRESAP